ncbi:MAG: ASCH domain-containing protein [Actinobacteria bacterium]|jgi:uncharacterized protein YhfF|nr:ASCH domain-containing protein [Actinomycetota bacterium]
MTEQETIAVREFWKQACANIAGAPDTVPEAWAFGATPDHADGLLALVLDGTKTGTASSFWDYEWTGDPLPAVGEYSIILDARNRPRAVIEIVEVAVVPFSAVTEQHAHSEGEGDRTLASWREIHERYWRLHSENPRGFEADMPVVCEQFRLVYREPVD